MWKIILLLGILSLFRIDRSSAQNTIAGKILDEKNIPIPNANILLKTDNKIIAFASSKNDGQFMLSYNPNTAGLQDALLEINHISYIRKQIPFETSKTYNVTLQGKQNELEEVKIGKPPAIRQKQDTLVYQVNSFADSADRTIGEVLRKIPGFHVAENGRIFYNGQAISDLLIDGDDLLGDRYALGTKNIPHKIVGTVEVYRNHQAIKVLKDKFNSNDIAVNLSIKESAQAELLGEISVGAGLTKQYHLHSSSIYLSKARKMLNDVTWTSLDDDIQTGMRDMSNEQSEEANNTLLRTGTTNILSEPNTNFKRNNSIGVFSNLLFKSKTNWNFKLNGGLYWDKKYMDTYASQQYLLSDGSITNTEQVAIVFKPLQLYLSLGLIKNTETNYFTNDLQFSLKNYHTADLITTSAFSIQEQLKQKLFTVTNSTQYIPATKSKNTWRFNWLNTFTHIPERQHYLSDSILTALQNIGSFVDVTQQLKKQELKSRLSADITLPAGNNFHRLYGGMAELKLSTFDSRLLENEQQLSLGTTNDNRWREMRASAYTQIQWNKKKIRLNAHIPVGIQSIHIEDLNEEAYKTRVKLLFTPNFNFRYIIDTRQQLKLKFTREQEFGKISDVYSGLLLTDFRTLNNAISEVPYTQRYNYELGYSLEFVEKMLFMNAQYGYTTAKQNLMHQLDISENSTRSEFIEQDNDLTTHNANLSFSKFISPLSGTSSLQVRFVKSRSERIINDVFIPFTVNQVDIVPMVRGKIGKVFNWVYNGSFSWNKGQSAIESMGNEHTRIQRHSVNLTYSFRNKLFWTAEGNIMNLKNQTANLNLQFLNTAVRYVTKRPVEMEYELRVTNLLNEKESNIVMVAPNINYSKSYTLRGRTVVLRVLMPLNSLFGK